MRIAATALALVGALAATGVVESAEAKAVCTRGADARTLLPPLRLFCFIFNNSVTFWAACFFASMDTMSDVP